MNKEAEGRRTLLEAVRRGRIYVADGRAAADELLAHDTSVEAKRKARSIRWNCTHLEREIERILTWCGYADEAALAELVAAS